MCMSVLPECMSEHHLDPSVSDLGCEAPCGCWGLNAGPSGGGISALRNRVIALDLVLGSWEGKMILIIR